MVPNHLIRLGRLHGNNSSSTAFGSACWVFVGEVGNQKNGFFGPPCDSKKSATSLFRDLQLKCQTPLIYFYKHGDFNSTAMLMAQNEKILCDKYKTTSFPPSICEHHKVNIQAVSRSATLVADDTYTNKGILRFWAASLAHFAKLWARLDTHFFHFFFIVLLPRNIQQNETCGALM